MDLATMLSGAGSGGGSDLASMLSGLSGTQKGATPAVSMAGTGLDMDGNMLASNLGAVGGGAAATAFGLPPQVGAQLGAALGGLFGGKGTPYSKGVFAGHHSTTMANLDDSRVKKPDADTYLRLAKQHDLSVEEVAILMAFDAQRNGISAQQVWDGYAAGTSPLEAYIPLFNATRQATITSGQLGPQGILSETLRAVANYDGSAQFIDLPTSTTQQAAGYAPGVQLGTPIASQAMAGAPVVSLAAASAPASMSSPLAQSVASSDAQGLGGMLGAILKGAANGAQKGATDAAADTELGKSMKKNYIKDFAADNQLLTAGIAIGLGWLIKQAIENQQNKR